MDARVKHCLQFIEQNPAEVSTVSRMARGMGLSRSRFEHLFKQETGSVFKSQLREARLAKAKALLRVPSLSVKQVAAFVGYSHTPNFTKDFKVRFGKTPSRYRKALPHSTFH